jgi:hypothetical protein
MHNEIADELLALYSQHLPTGFVNLIAFSDQTLQTGQGLSDVGTLGERSDELSIRLWRSSIRQLRKFLCPSAGECGTAVGKDTTVVTAAIATGIAGVVCLHVPVDMVTATAAVASVLRLADKYSCAVFCDLTKDFG